MKNKKILYLSVIGTMICVLLGVSFAFYMKRNIEGNVNNLIALNTIDYGTITLSYAEGYDNFHFTEVDLPQDESGNDKLYMIKFQINSTANFNQNVIIKWSNLTNTFCRYADGQTCTNDETDTYVGNELTYQLYRCEESIYTGFTSAYQSLNSCTALSGSVEPAVPLSSSNDLIHEDPFVSLPANSTTYFVLQIRLKNLVETQRYNMSKTFNGAIELAYFGMDIKNTPGNYEIIIPTSGTYHFDVSGAQGEDGGNGGTVGGNIVLTAGEIVNVKVGGQTGDYAGGTGVKSGGGASTITITRDSTPIIVLVGAGGGGGTGATSGGTDNGAGGESVGSTAGTAGTGGSGGGSSADYASSYCSSCSISDTSCTYTDSVNVICTSDCSIGLGAGTCTTSGTIVFDQSCAGGATSCGNSSTIKEATRVTRTCNCTTTQNTTTNCSSGYTSCLSWDQSNISGNPGNGGSNNYNNTYITNYTSINGNKTGNGEVIMTIVN